MRARSSDPTHPVAASNDDALAREINLPHHGASVYASICTRHEVFRFVEEYKERREITLS